MYTEFDYLSIEILNNIEDKIKELYQKYKYYTSEKYVAKVWKINDLVYADDIAHIEDAIEYLGNSLNYPEGWIISREWNLTGVNNISYKDINRLLNNLKLIEENMFKNLLPSEALYPSETLYPSKESEKGGR